MAATENCIEPFPEQELKLRVLWEAPDPDTLFTHAAPPVACTRMSLELRVTLLAPTKKIEKETVPALFTRVCEAAPMVTPGGGSVV